jgi:hypothetical protein
LFSNQFTKSKNDSGSWLKIVYNYAMAKRDTGVGKMKRAHSYKTKKRLTVKREMLALKASKHRK